MSSVSEPIEINEGRKEIEFKEIKKLKILRRYLSTNRVVNRTDHWRHLIERGGGPP